MANVRKIERKQREWSLRRSKRELRELESKGQYSKLNYKSRRKYRQNFKKLNRAKVALDFNKPKRSALKKSVSFIKRFIK